MTTETTVPTVARDALVATGGHWVILGLAVALAVVFAVAFAQDRRDQ